ncbi:MAG: UDP-N-acetylmuramoyl-L-alanine--D-glutamate ligase [Patescibacteria group bacterium]
MKKYENKITPTVFEFTSYEFNPKKKRIFFNYRIKFKNRRSLEFRETILLPCVPKLRNIPKPVLDSALQATHIILGTSYFKLYCPPKIKLSYLLSPEQAEFWNTVYKRGFGEFLYQNEIDPASLPKFPSDKTHKNISYGLELNNKSLVGVGGGKDSIVVAELLKEQKKQFSTFVVETGRPTKIIEDVADKIDVPLLKICRYLDEKIFQPHEGSYNGHIPISATFAFLGLLSAILYGYKYVIVANEHSSNFGNINYKGLDINHQWSKSSEFEELVQSYTRNFITPSIVYFSALRPFYEIRIVEMFIRYKKYFPIFSSCNKSFLVSKDRPEGLWCGECPKCAFIFLLFAAFLSKKELLAIFKKNLFEDDKLLPLFGDILGFGKMKPFDCVGTFEEARAALYLSRKRFKNSLVTEEYLSLIKNPREKMSNVFRTNPSPLIPTEFRFLGVKNVLIMGYAREGQITHRYLRKFYPWLKIGIADKKYNEKYLLKQKQFDAAVKTVGMPPRLIEIPYTTATNLFFTEIKKRGNKIIGITGSKGKSTTASLIYTILKEAGQPVELWGNIGVPMLGALLKPVRKKTIYVLELSSYMLGDLDNSPNISVVTNLFPEHMDYHGDLERYYGAKKNIIAFQIEKDFFVYNQNNSRLVEWAAGARSQTAPFAANIPLKDDEIPLLGSHNRENIRAAIAACRILGISDETIRRAIRSFQALPHRLQKVGTFNGVTFYDDAISTTPESTIAALESVPGVKTIFLGGQDRGYDFTELEKTIRSLGIKNVVLFPESGRRIFNSRQCLNIFETSSMEEAVRFAYQNTPTGGVCLLSTASPSYSVWKDFEEKGNEFQSWVKKLEIVD